MIKSLRRTPLVLLAAFSLIGMNLSGVAAQTKGGQSANGFRVSPVRSEISIEKGKSQDITISVENPANIPVTAKAVVNDFVASDDESGTPRLILDDKAPLPKNNFKSLVGEIPSVDLAAKERKDVSVKISVPENASAGGYYGAIRFVPADTNNTSNLALTASVGSIVLLTVPGNLQEKVDLKQLSAANSKGNAKSFFTGGDVSILTRLTNSGDIHVQPFGKTQVKSMFGKVVYSYEFNNTDPRANILPGSTRKFVDPLKKSGLIGRYTIITNLAYTQGGGQLVSGTAVFWYVPAWILYVLLVLILAIAAGAYLMYKKYTNRRRHGVK